MPEITSHAQYINAQKHLRRLKGTARAELAEAIRQWKETANQNRGNAGADLEALGLRLKSPDLIRGGRSNIHGLTPRKHARTGH